MTWEIRQNCKSQKLKSWMDRRSESVERVSHRSFRGFPAQLIFGFCVVIVNTHKNNCLPLTSCSSFLSCPRAFSFSTVDVNKNKESRSSQMRRIWKPKMLPYLRLLKYFLISLHIFFIEFASFSATVICPSEARMFRTKNTIPDPTQTSKSLDARLPMTHHLPHSSFPRSGEVTRYMSLSTELTCSHLPWPIRLF